MTHMPMISRSSPIAALALLLTLFSAACGGTARPETVASTSPAAEAATEAPAGDLTGRWTLSVTSPNGRGTRDVTFFQEGNFLTGNISSTRSSGELEGTIAGTRVRWVAVVQMAVASDFEIVYEATLDGETLVDGTIDFGSYGSGTFTGERAQGF